MYMPASANPHLLRGITRAQPSQASAVVTDFLLAQFEAAAGSLNTTPSFKILDLAYAILWAL